MVTTGQSRTAWRRCFTTSLPPKSQCPTDIRGCRHAEVKDRFEPSKRLSETSTRGRSVMTPLIRAFNNRPLCKAKRSHGGSKIIGSWLFRVAIYVRSSSRSDATHHAAHRVSGLRFRVSHLRAAVLRKGSLLEPVARRRGGQFPSALCLQRWIKRDMSDTGRPRGSIESQRYTDPVGVRECSGPN